MVGFLKAELGCGPVIQCNLSCNYSRNSLERGVTGALRETLRRVAYCKTGKILARHFATAAEESWNLVLLSAAVEANCFSRGLTVTRCVTRCCFIELATPLSRRLRDMLRDRLHCIAGLCLNTSVYLVSNGGLLVKMRTQKLPLCLFICVLLC